VCCPAAVGSEERQITDVLGNTAASTPVELDAVRRTAAVAVDADGHRDEASCWPIDNADVACSEALADRAVLPYGSTALASERIR
jgi:hypothetical protein